MREIKFRAWDLEVNEMCFDFLEKNWLKVCINSPYVKIMQSTGLKDRNGVEIYEGDIVKYRFDVNPNSESGAKERISEVFWSEFRGSWAVCSNGSRKSLNNDLFHYVQNGNTVEVIGNIYEHKKLLATT